MNTRVGALLASLIVAGCSHGPQVNLRPGDELAVTSAAIYPFTFRWDEPAYRSFELGEAMVLQTLETGRYAVFGPGEFKLIRATSDNPFVGSDLALGLADRGLSPTQAIVFRPTAERRSQSALKELYDDNGKPKGQANVLETTIVVRLEVFHSASREIIADLTDSVQLDPLADREATDPTPELTALVHRMMAATLDALEKRAPGKPVRREPGFAYLWVPKQAFDFSIEGKPPFNELLGKAEELDRDILVDARLRYFHPKLDDATLARLKRAPAGLYVTEAGEPAVKAGLQSGDVVVSVAGESAMPQVLDRALRTTEPGKTVALKVRRATGMVDVALPVVAGE